MIDEIEGSCTRTQEEKKKRKEKIKVCHCLELNDIEKVTLLLYIDSSSEQQRRLKNTVIFLLLLKWVAYLFLQCFCISQKKRWSSLDDTQGWGGPTHVSYSSNTILCKRRHGNIQNPVISRVSPEYLQWALMANKSLISSLTIHTK